MSKPNFIIQGQRKSDAGWQPCLNHEAQRFVVLSKLIFTRKGKRYATTRKLASYATLEQAKQHLASASRGVAPNKRGIPRINERWPRTTESPAPIAKGLGRNFIQKEPSK